MTDRTVVSMDVPESLPASYRHRFPITESQIYVNSCSQGALSDVVREAYEEYLEGWDRHGAEWMHWVERAESVRAAMARLLSVEADEIAIQTSVSSAVSALVSSLDFREGRNRIVISEYEFPTIGQIAHAQELRGAEVVHVQPDPEAYEAVVDERTALVCSTLVSYRTGARYDVEAIHEVARESGALMLVDAYQGVGALPLDASAAGDVVVGGAVKYLLASAGLAYMYSRCDVTDRLRPMQTGWFADENIFDMQIGSYRPHPSARRFDSGTPPVPNLYAGLAGIELIEEAGVERIAAHVIGLAERLIAGCEELRAQVVSLPPRSPLVCIRSKDAQTLVAALGKEGIVASDRDSNLRISLHLYNTEEDVDAVLGALARNRGLLG